MSENVVDPSNEWLHNGFGVANDPGVLTQLLEKEGADPEGAKLFYYEVFEEEIDSDGWTFDRDAWQPLSLLRRLPQSPVDVSVPRLTSSANCSATTSSTSGTSLSTRPYLAIRLQRISRSTNTAFSILWTKQSVPSTPAASAAALRRVSTRSSP